MARPRRSQAIREQLLDEGLKAFLERGYHGTGIKEVLDRVDVPKGSFYNYFATKEAFGAEVIEHYAEGFGRKLAAALDGAPDPVTGLRRFFNRLMKEFKDAGFVGGCLVANLGGEIEGSDVCRTALSSAWNDWREGVEVALSEGQKLGLVRDDVPVKVAFVARWAV